MGAVTTEATSAVAIAMPTSMMKSTAPIASTTAAMAAMIMLMSTIAFIPRACITAAAHAPASAASAMRSR